MNFKKYAPTVLLILLITLLALLAWHALNNIHSQHAAKIKEYKDKILILEHSVDSILISANTLTLQRDSTYRQLTKKISTDSIQIHKKHEKIRSDIVILDDSGKVRLLSKNLGR